MSCECTSQKKDKLLFLDNGSAKTELVSISVYAYFLLKKIGAAIRVTTENLESLGGQGNESMKRMKNEIKLALG